MATTASFVHYSCNRAKTLINERSRVVDTSCANNIFCYLSLLLNKKYLFAREEGTQLSFDSANLVKEHLDINCFP